MTQIQTPRPLKGRRRTAAQATPPTAAREPYREEQLPRVLLLADFTANVDEYTTFGQFRTALRGSDIDQEAFPDWFHAMDDTLPFTRRAAAVLLLSVVQQ